MKTTAAAVLLAAAACAAPCAAPPQSVSGTFVQRRTLSDVGVTLKSSGRFLYERGRRFEWETLEPVRSVFAATPTNWSFTAEGKTSARAMRLKLDSVSDMFKIREMADAVSKIETEGEPFPSRIRVVFKNGDIHEMTLERDSGNAR